LSCTINESILSWLKDHGLENKINNVHVVSYPSGPEMADETPYTVLVKEKDSETIADKIDCLEHMEAILL
jgi:hypothetical protein